MIVEALNLILIYPTYDGDLHFLILFVLQTSHSVSL